MSVNFLPCNVSASCATDASTQLPLFFIPGWGFDGRIMELASSPAGCFAPAVFFDPAGFSAGLLSYLDRAGINKIRLAGWSMGANLALDFARLHPDRVDSLFLFSMRKSWPDSEIAAIRRDLAVDPVSFMKSFYRKCFAGDRAGHARFVDQLQATYLNEMDPALLARGLDYLATAAIEAPVGVNDVHLFHGRRDIIAPVDDMARLSGAEVEIYDLGGHALFLGRDFVWPECGFAARKKTIQHRFSRAAATYDDHADVQKEVARDLAAQLGDIRPRTVLEIGCGSGNYTGLLAERFPDSDILAIDFAPGMIEAAGSRFCDAKRIKFLCCDGEEFLVSCDQKFDLITSNATLQWFDDPFTAFAGIVSALNETGMMLCSLFGPETLGELARGLSEVCGQGVHLPPHRFPSLADLRSTLDGLLPGVLCTEQLVQRQYSSLRELLLHIRKTGTSGWRSGNRPLLTKGRMRELEQWFISEYGGFQVTYQTFVVQGRKLGEQHG